MPQDPKQSDKHKGRFTFRFASVCFGISAVGEAFGLQDNTVMFGATVGGAGAFAYHLTYIILFAWLTVGLWRGSRSGLFALLATTIYYTIDRLQLILVGDSLNILLRNEMAGAEGLLPAADINYLVEILRISIIAFVLSWWGFVVYAYIRRSYFGIQ